MVLPPNTAIAVGDTVTWTNRMAMNHTVTADAGAFDSGPLGNGASFSHTFPAAGAVAYHCSIHPFMKGKVTAEAVQPEVTTHDIEITTMAFPPDTAIAVGDTVTWTNRMSMDHTVKADAGEFDSGPLGNGASFSHTFPAAGAVAYHCNIHPFMKGKVTAEPVQLDETAVTHAIEITTMAFPPGHRDRGRRHRDLDHPHGDEPHGHGGRGRVRQRAARQRRVVLAHVCGGGGGRLSLQHSRLHEGDGDRELIVGRPRRREMRWPTCGRSGS